MATQTWCDICGRNITSLASATSLKDLGIHDVCGGCIQRIRQFIREQQRGAKIEEIPASLKEEEDHENDEDQ